MADRDIRREIDANNLRGENPQDDSDPELVKRAEDVLNPVVDAIGTAEDEDREDVERRRLENDAEQREG